MQVVLLSLTRTDVGDVAIGEAIVLAPNEARVLGVDLTRANFVVNHTNLELSNGMLTKFDLSKPSEALGFIQIPIDVAKSIVSIPSALFKFKTTSVTQDAGLINAQGSRLDSQAKLLDSQQKLLDAQRNAAASALGQPVQE